LNCLDVIKESSWLISGRGVKSDFECGETQEYGAISRRRYIPDFINPMYPHINWLLAPFEAQWLIVPTSRAPARAADVETTRNCPRNKPDRLICSNPMW